MTIYRGTGSAGSGVAADYMLDADLSNTGTVTLGDALVGFKQSNTSGALTGAVARTVHAKLQEAVSVFDFMTSAEIADVVARTAAVDVTAAISAAVAALTLAGGGRLYFPAGTYSHSGLTVSGSNILFYGEGPLSKLLFSDSGVRYWWVLDGCSNVTFRDLQFDLGSNTGDDGIGSHAIYLQSTVATTSEITVENCKFVNSYIRPFIDNQATIAGTGYHYRNNHFTGPTSLISRASPNPQTGQAIRFLTSAVTENINVVGNTFVSVGNFLQMRPATTPQQYDRYINVRICDNSVTDILDDPNIGTSPLEAFGCTNITVQGNRIDSGGRGLNACYCKSAAYTDNTLSNQTIYFMEMQSCDGIVISDNTAYNCKTFINDTSENSYAGTKNCTISGNTVVGGNVGITGYNDGNFGNFITMQSGNTTGYFNWKIVNNSFIGPTYVTTVIRIDAANSANFDISGNTFLFSSEYATGPAIHVANGSNINVRNNVIRRTADVTSNSGAGTSVYAFVMIPNGTGGSNINVVDNTILWEGSDSRGGGPYGVMGIGANLSAAALAGVTVSRNKLTGTFTPSYAIFLQITSGDTIVHDNDVKGATGTYLLNAAIVYKKTNSITSGTAAPTAGTWAVGDVCFNTSVTIASILGWTCVVAGTPGTWDVLSSRGEQHGMTPVGDAAATLTPGTSRSVLYYNAPITADRTVTLSTTGAWVGCRFKVVRSAACTGAYNISVGGKKTLTTAGEWAEVTYYGSAWYLTGYGTL